MFPQRFMEILREKSENVGYDAEKSTSIHVLLRHLLTHQSLDDGGRPLRYILHLDIGCCMLDIEQPSIDRIQT